MNESSSLIKTYLFIRKNRFRRKQGLYKTALSIMVDKTTAIYLLVLLGYFFASFFIMGDFINDYKHFFVLIEDYAKHYIWFILTLIPTRSVMQSFSNSGVIYSTSEHQLSFLPYSRKGIWFISVLEKWLKSIVGFSLIGLLIILITPLSARLVITFILLVLVMQIVMTIPQWMLYQKRFFYKLGWLILILIINALYLYTSYLWLGIMLVGILVMMNFFLLKNIFRQVNWSEVTETSDFKVWNMPLISRASGVKIKRQKKYSFFQNLNFRKKPFAYTEKSIHHRMWSLYFVKNIGLIIQFLGAIVILLFVLMFTKPILFQIALAFSLHAFTAILASFYSGRFEVDVLPVLPWNLFRYKSTFLKWANYGALIIFIPILVALSMTATLWAPIQLLFYMSVYYYLYHVKINKSIILLARKRMTTDLAETIGYVLLLGIIFSVKYPALSLGFIGVFWFTKRKRTFKLSEEADSPF